MSADSGPDVHSTYQTGLIRMTELSVPAHTAVPVHDHSGHHLCAVLDGEFDEVHCDGLVRCTDRTVRFSPEWDRHDVRILDGRMRCVIFETTSGPIPNAQQRRYVHDATISHTARSIVSQCDASQAPSPLVIDSKVLELFAQVLLHGTLPGRSATRPVWIDHVRDALHDDPANPPTLVTLAGRVARHPVHVARTFREHLGCSIGDYARRLQLEIARKRLVETDEPIAMIAYSAGFADQSHLTRLLRRFLGVTPARLRAMDKIGRATD